MALRTELVYLVLALTIAITGCAAPSPTNTSPTAKSFPAQPETVTSDSVGPYVADFEEVYRHNVILATTLADSITELSVNCTPLAVDPRGSENQVRVDCGFSWEYTDDGSTGIADGVPYEATYWVSSGLVERTGSTLAQ